MSNNKKIGIICAMAVELKGIKEEMKNKQEHTVAGIIFYTGNINDTEVVAVECGIGKVNAAMCTQIMIDKFSPDAIVNSGVAGSVSPELQVGDVVIATEVVHHDMNSSALGDPLGEIDFPDEKRVYFPCDQKIIIALAEASKNIEVKTCTGVIASGDLFVSEVSQREKIAKRFNALACEMEGAAVGHVCYRNGVPFCVFRAISDDLNHSEGVDFVSFCKETSKKSIKVINSFISNYDAI